MKTEARIVFTTELIRCGCRRQVFGANNRTAILLFYRRPSPPKLQGQNQYRAVAEYYLSHTAFIGQQTRKQFRQCRILRADNCYRAAKRFAAGDFKFAHEFAGR